jgi:hypothetical protein
MGGPEPLIIADEETPELLARRAALRPRSSVVPA